MGGTIMRGKKEILGKYEALEHFDYFLSDLRFGNGRVHTDLFRPSYFHRKLDATLSRNEPPPRQGSAMVYDSVHNQTVLFGGEDSTGVLLKDTWVFNGTTWTHLNPATSPGIRRDHAMVFDPATGQVLLFGGESTTSPLTPLGDTWVWDGTNWTPVASSGPNPRRGSAMAYDPVRNRVVLFGGYDGTTLYGDTWTWNGSSWQQMPATGPSAREYASASFDGVNG